MFAAIAWVAVALAGLGFAVCLVMRLRDGRDERVARRALIGLSGGAAGVYRTDMVADLPEPAQRYFAFSIASGARLYRAVAIDMSGELGLGTIAAPGYRSMAAQQILAPPYGLLWRVQAGALSGSDGVTPHTSWTRFRLFGLLPVVRAGGDRDHQRSAFGRVIAESVFWAPASILPGEGVTWHAVDACRARVVVRCGGFEQAVELTVAADGRPTSVVMQRWSNANTDKIYRLQPFGGYLSEFRQFEGYTLPTVVEGGNHIGTDDYFPFYKARVEKLQFLHAAE